MRVMADSSKPVLPGSEKNSMGPGADHGVVGDSLGGLQVALEVGVLHELDVAEIGEALAADRVAGGVDAGIEIEPGQVADGVAVLAAGEAAHGDASGVAIVLFDVGIQLGADPGGDLRRAANRRAAACLWAACDPVRGPRRRVAIAENCRRPGPLAAICSRRIPPMAAALL